MISVDQHSNLLAHVPMAAGLGNEGQNQKINTNNKSFETVAKFKHLGTTLTNQRCVCVCVTIKGRLNSKNACYLSVQNLLSSGFFIKNERMKIYTSVIFSFVLYQCEILSLTLREENGCRYLK
jgi:hypothetical protein